MDFRKFSAGQGVIACRPRRPRSAAKSDVGCAPCQCFHQRPETIAAPGALLLGVCLDRRQIRRHDHVPEQTAIGRVACRGRQERCGAVAA